MKNHTKGRWRQDGSYIVADKPGGETVTVCQLGNVDTVVMHPSRTAARANALLIKRAPEMYAAIKALIERAGKCSIYETDQKTGYTFYEALRKAMGLRT